MPDDKLTPWDAPLRTPDQKWIDANFTPEQINMKTKAMSRSAINKKVPSKLDKALEEFAQTAAERQAARMNGKRWVPGKPIDEYSYRWWKPRKGKKFHLPFNPFSMTEGPLVYVMYGAIVAMQSIMIIHSPNENHIITDFSLGVNFGLMVFTFFKRMDEKGNKTRRDIDRQLDQMEIEMQLRDEFRRTGKI